MPIAVYTMHVRHTRTIAIFDKYSVPLRVKLKHEDHMCLIVIIGTVYFTIIHRWTFDIHCLSDRFTAA